jgi:hypothetical protein
METFYQILSVLGVAGIIGVGVWVGVIQTKVSAHDAVEDASKKNHDLLVSHNGVISDFRSDHDLLMADHDLLIRLDEKVSLILQKLEKASG